MSYRSDITKDELIELIKDRTNKIATNVSINMIYGKSSVYLFSNKIKDIIVNNNPLFIIIPKDSKKSENNKWEHDLSSFQIHSIDTNTLLDQNIDITNTEIYSNTTESIKINISNNSLIYSSENGITDNINLERNFNLKEKACLYLRIPESGTPWLDNLIKKSLEWD